MVRVMQTCNDWADRCRDLARQVREHCLRMTHRGHSGHVGSMLSMAEIVSVLYTRVLHVDPCDPRKADRDRFVLSKGHGGCAVYAVLGELGFFPKTWFEGCYRDEGKPKWFWPRSTRVWRPRPSAGFARPEGATVALTRLLAVGFGRQGIRVNCICPAGAETEMLKANNLDNQALDAPGLF